MTTIPPEAPVLVTGCTGYIGAAIALDFLAHGHRVRGTVRSQAKFDRLLALLHFAPHRSRFEAVVVQDLVHGNFAAKAMRGGVRVIVHTASPCMMATEEVEERVLRPAIEGTKNVVRAAIASGSVEHIIVASSLCAAMSLADGTPVAQPAPRVYTEADWNQSTYEGALGSEMPGFAYAVSKALAERAAYSVDNMMDSLTRIWAAVSGASGADVPPWVFPAASELQAFASAHRLAWERGAEGRYMINSEPFDLAMVVDVAREHFPQHAHRLPTVKPK